MLSEAVLSGISTVENISTILVGFSVQCELGLDSENTCCIEQLYLLNIGLHHGSDFIHANMFNDHILFLMT